jgi:hypothetical protein
MTNANSLLGELDEAVVSGTRRDAALMYKFARRSRTLGWTTATKSACHLSSVAARVPASRAHGGWNRRESE